MRPIQRPNFFENQIKVLSVPRLGGSKALKASCHTQMKVTQSGAKKEGAYLPDDKKQFRQNNFQNIGFECIGRAAFKLVGGLIPNNPKNGLSPRTAIWEKFLWRLRGSLATSRLRCCVTLTRAIFMTLSCEKIHSKKGQTWPKTS